jgi:hypothetical protein
MSCLALIDLDWFEERVSDDENASEKLIGHIEKEFSVQFGTNKFFVSKKKNTPLGEMKKLNIDYNQFDVE